MSVSRLHLCALLLAVTATFIPLSQPFADDYGPAIARAEALGQALYLHDRAAWLATDELQRRGVLRAESRVQGWITEEIGETFRVSFMGGPADAAKVYYQVDVDRGRLLNDSFLTYEGGAAPSARAALLWKARTIALASSRPPCEGAYNTVVIPSSGSGEPGGLYVYLLWATTDPNVMNIGGHLRVEMTARGDRIVGTKAFSNSCFSMPKAPASDPHSPVVAVYMTHLLAPHPEENHVFVALLHGCEFLVGTEESRTIWSVKEGRIAVLRHL